MMRVSITLIAGIAALCVAGSSAFAQTAGSPGDFTFKRVKVPRPGSGPRITVQIQPKAEEAPATSSKEADDTADTGKATLAYDWFWSEISPSLSAAGPGRLDLALRAIQKGPGVAAPRLDELRKMVEAHSADIMLATVGRKVSPALVLAVMAVESSGDATAESPAGAKGLMQLMPRTAEHFGVSEADDPGQNIRAGVSFLEQLLQRYDGDPILALAAYNAGETAVERYEGVPPFTETRGYVPKVLAAWAVARGLCQTPPELITDGCAFDLRGS